MMEKRGNEIYLTSKAKQLLELVPCGSEKAGTYCRLGEKAV